MTMYRGRSGPAGWPVTAHRLRPLPHLALAAGFALLLSSCTMSPPVDPLTLDRVEASADASYFDLFGHHLRGDARVFVCNGRASLVVVQDATGEVVADSLRSGVIARFRLGDLGPDPRICDVRVEQARSVLPGVERATLAGALVYLPRSPLAGSRVLMYANLYGNGAEQNPAARLATAVRTVETGEELDLTVVDGTPSEYLDGAVALAFGVALTAGDWDVVVFIEEDVTVPTSVLEAVGAFVQGGGRALGSYWLVYRPDEEFGAPARALAAAFGAAVTPEDNVEPVADGRIGIELAPPLNTGLSGPYELINAGYYVLSYAQRLTPVEGATSVCAYTDAEGGSCAVRNAIGTSIYLGFTLAPLSESMTGAELETLFSNLLRYVVLED